MSGILVAALAAALVGSPHCVGMCGPLVSATGRSGLPWHAGRLATYATLGALAGALGSPRLFGSAVSTGVAVALLVFFAARLAGVVPAPHVRLPGLTTASAALLRRGGRLAHFGFGAVSGLLPCGHLWSALALAVASGSPLAGAAAMGLFWLGTLPALSAASVLLRKLAAARPWARLVVATVVLAAGLFSIGTRSALSWDAPHCHEPSPR